MTDGCQDGSIRLMYAYDGGTDLPANNLSKPPKDARPSEGRMCRPHASAVAVRVTAVAAVSHLHRRVGEKDSHGEAGHTLRRVEALQ